MKYEIVNAVAEADDANHVDFALPGKRIVDVLRSENTRPGSPNAEWYLTLLVEEDAA